MSGSLTCQLSHCVMLCFAAACLWEEGDWWSAAVAAEHWLMEAVIDIILAVVFCSFQQRLVVSLIFCSVLKIAAKVSRTSQAMGIRSHRDTSNLNLGLTENGR